MEIEFLLNLPRLCRGNYVTGNYQPFKQMDYWKILLIEQQKRGKRGLTIPFILGSQRYLTSQPANQDIEGLLTAIVENESFRTRLRYCPDINELLLEKIDSPDYSVFPSFRKSKQKQFAISKFNNNLGDSVEEICQSLCEKYENVLQSGLFSLFERRDERENIWKDYSLDDQEFIIECFEIMHD